MNLIFQFLKGYHTEGRKGGDSSNDLLSIIPEWRKWNDVYHWDKLYIIFWLKVNKHFLRIITVGQLNQLSRVTVETLLLNMVK